MGPDGCKFNSNLSLFCLNIELVTSGLIDIYGISNEFAIILAWFNTFDLPIVIIAIIPDFICLHTYIGL